MAAYAIFCLIGVCAGALAARAVRMPKPEGDKDWTVYAVCAAGMIVGAKLPVWIAYGYTGLSPYSGKSVMGGLLGAFVAVNLYKWITRQTGAAFGGRFVIPVSIAVGFGKIGCFFNGCCGGSLLGCPPQLAESAFQFLMAGSLYVFYKRTGRADLLFPLYLLAYLTMRFFMEFARTEPVSAFGLTAYQLLAIVFAPVFVWIILRRRKIRA